MGKSRKAWIFLFIVVLFPLLSVIQNNLVQEQNFEEKNPSNLPKNEAQINLSSESTEDLWFSTFESSQNDSTRVGCIWVNGSFIYTCGWSGNKIPRRLFINKWNENGTRIWDKIWTVPEYRAHYIYSIDGDNDSVYICGEDDLGGFIKRVDGDGNLLLELSYGRRINSLRIQNDSIFTVGTRYNSYSYEYESKLIKWNKNGTILFERNIDSFSFIPDSKIWGDGQHLYFFLGSSETKIYKYDEFGNQIWKRATLLRSVTGFVGNNESLYVCSPYGVNSGIEKWDHNGNRILNVTFGNQKMVSLNEIDQYLFATGYDYQNDDKDILLAKLDSNLNMIWHKRWGGIDSDQGGDIFITDHIYILGTSESLSDTLYKPEYEYGPYNSVMILMKWDRNGNTKNLSLPSSPVLYNVNPDFAVQGKVFLNWSEVPGARYYYIYRDSMPIVSVDGRSKEFLIKGANFTISGLQDGKTYFAVTAANGSGESNVSNYVNNMVDIPDFCTYDTFQVWNRSWGGNNHEDGSLMWMEHDSIYTCGYNFSFEGPYGIESSSDTVYDRAFLIKWDKNGNQIWNRSWNAHVYPSFTSIWGKNDSLYLSGGYYDFFDDMSWNRSIFLIKFDSDGNLLWNRTWNEESSFRFLDISGNSTHIVTICQNRTYGNYQYYTQIWNSDGDLEDTIKWELKEDEHYNSFWRQGDYIYACGTLTGGYYSNQKLAIAKWDLLGNHVWSRYYFDYVSYINYEWDGSSGTSIWGDGIFLYTLGQIEKNDNWGDPEDTDLIIIKWDENGEIVWERSTDFKKFDYAIQIQGNATESCFYVLGNSKAGKYYQDLHSYDIILMKWSLKGNDLWNRVWGGQYFDYGKDICISHNEVYTVGISFSYTHGCGDLLLIKWDLSSIIGPQGNDPYPPSVLTLTQKIWFIVLGLGVIGTITVVIIKENVMKNREIK